MKHELKDLDQFFEAARHEAPVVDDSDVLALLGGVDPHRHQDKPEPNAAFPKDAAHTVSLLRIGCARAIRR